MITADNGESDAFVTIQVWCIDHAALVMLEHLNSSDPDNYRFHGACVDVTDEIAEMMELKNEKFFCDPCTELLKGKTVFLSSRSIVQCGSHVYTRHTRDTIPHGYIKYNSLRTPDQALERYARRGFALSWLPFCATKVALQRSVNAISDVSLTLAAQSMRCH